MIFKFDCSVKCDSHDENLISTSEKKHNIAPHIVRWQLNLMINCYTFCEPISYLVICFPLFPIAKYTRSRDAFGTQIDLYRILFFLAT